MRAVLQRVRSAQVEIDGTLHCQIGPGILALVGFLDADNDAVFDYILDKLVNLRIFEDETGKMNRSVQDRNGSLLIVPNFTLYGDARHGRRPSYSGGASPAAAAPLYARFVGKARSLPLTVETGVFQAQMQVALVNDGPVTILLDSEKVF